MVSVSPADRDAAAFSALVEAIQLHAQNIPSITGRLKRGHAVMHCLAEAADQIQVVRALPNLPSEVEVALTKLGKALISLGQEMRDDAQSANVDLQNVLQKQQQALQTISCILKIIYDTEMAVIRKMGG